jgi:hypothetical protein
MRRALCPRTFFFRRCLESVRRGGRKRRELPSKSLVNTLGIGCDQTVLSAENPMSPICSLLSRRNLTEFGRARNEPDAVDKVNQTLAGINHMDHILDSARARKAEELAQEYARHRPGAIKLIHKPLASGSLSIDALMVTALTEELDNIERIDHLTTIAETRRNVMLREIDRRRAVLGEALRRQVQEVEGEFEVIDKTPAQAKSAA